MKKIMIKQRIGAWVDNQDRRISAWVASKEIDIGYACVVFTLFLAVLGSLVLAITERKMDERGTPELHARSVVIAAQLPAPQPTLTQELHVCAIETETEDSGVQSEITATLSYTLYVPLMICPEAIPLPAACYTTTPLFARQQCLLELDTSYVISFTAWQRSDLFLGFPIEQQIQAVVDNYSEPAADVDLRFWGENSQGSNVPGPFHPAAPGGPIQATWIPQYPYRTPGIYLVELFAYTPYDFTVRLRVEKE